MGVIETRFSVEELAHLAALPSIVIDRAEDQDAALYAGWCVVGCDPPSDAYDWWESCRARHCDLAMHVDPASPYTYVRHGEALMRTEAVWTGVLADYDARDEVVAWLESQHDEEEVTQ